jgi:esterase/lipase superfamily enzyme
LLPVSADRRTRSPLGESQKNPNNYFTGNLDAEFKDFSYGTANVTIPTKRKRGELNLPSWWTFTSQPDPAHYFVLHDIVNSDRNAILKDLNEAGADPKASPLLFVHGFNVTFANALFRAAQLAHDLEFPGKVMLYSWPSGGRIVDYWKDEESAQISAPRFQQLLMDLIGTRIRRIYIVAHSMGTRIVIRSVSELRNNHVPADT